MFGKGKEKKREQEKKQGYQISYDNVAVPEVHTQPEEEEKDSAEETPGVNYDSVAIPEIHIRKK